MADIREYHVREFLKSLDPQLRRAYESAHNVVLSTRDTLENDFQIAAAIQRVFWDFLKERYAEDSQEDFESTLKSLATPLTR